MTTANTDILTAVRSQFDSAPPAKMGIAVSGGGDSNALMHILAHCFEPGQVQLFAATVDHGLRPEAADEAQQAGDLAKSLGIPHEILKWRGWDGTGNLQDQARRARYRLLTDWAKSNGVSIIAIGHTADDQAETVLMRLGRSAGVTGLSAMPARRTMHGVTLFRPLLAISRAHLRKYLTQNGIGWADDPSNEDLRYNRIKARRAIDMLEPLGLTVGALADVARNMAQANEALNWYTFSAARELVTIIGGNVVLDLDKFRTLPDETARRLLLRALMWIGQAEYPPRSVPMSETVNAVRLGQSTTLAGCRVLRQGRQMWVCREFNAVRGSISRGTSIWDGRWRLTGGDATGCELRALGPHGLRLCPNWRETGCPNAALTASPAVWRGDELVAAPLAKLANGWAAELVNGTEEFFSTLLSH